MNQIEKHEKAIGLIKAIDHFEEQKDMWKGVRKDYEGLFTTGGELEHKIDICDRAIRRLNRIYNNLILTI